MAANENKGANRRRWARVLGLVPASTEIPAPEHPLPDVKTQIESLEALASELAKNGHDVAEASRIRDALRKMVQSEDASDVFKEKLNGNGSNEV